MVFSVYTHTNLLGYQIIPIDGWEERDVETGKGEVRQEAKKEVIYSILFKNGYMVVLKPSPKIL